MWPDNETDRDFLNFTGVADTVAEIIVQAGGRPISIGVSGAWGVGKSSLIKMVRCALEKRAPGANPQFVFVEFNAWLYQGYDDARAALMEVIADKLADEAERRKTGCEKAKELLKRVNWFRAAKLAAGSVAALAFGLPSVGLIGEAYQLGKTVASGEVNGETIAGAEKVGVEAGVATNALIRPKPESSPPKEIHAIRACFEATLSEMGITLVVLIDDLDRCLPTTTISTLEAIRLFLFLKNTAFVIAADDQMIKHAVRRHFEGVEEHVVTSYFDKLIQVPIRVPSLGTQEVRAYMMLLFVERSSLTAEDKEKIRDAVCRQLQCSWQGKRVDRAFMERLQQTWPSGLVGQFDMADRLALLMTTASQVAGNPRLIKRFLNALSIRMSIARAHGVSVDEAALAKMLLFERCGNPDVYAQLIKAVSEDEDGKPRFLDNWEQKALAGEKVELPAPWDRDSTFVREWLTIPPRIADVDLRGILYVSREHSPLITPEDRLSSDAAEILTALLEHPEMAASIRGRLAQVQKPQMAILMGRLLDRARREQVWGAPPILDACLAVVDTDDSQGNLLASFLRERPPTQIQASIVPKISNRPWASDLFEHWRSVGVSAPVKRAITITQQGTNGNRSI